MINDKEYRDFIENIIRDLRELDQLRERNEILSTKNKALEATVLRQEKLLKAYRYNQPIDIENTANEIIHALPKSHPW